MIRPHVARVLGLAGAGALTLVLRAQQPTPGVDQTIYTVIIQAEAVPETCAISSNKQRAPGGTPPRWDGFEGKPLPPPDTYARGVALIRTLAFDGSPAASFKAVIECPGYAAELLDVALSPFGLRVETRRLRPLRQVRVSGAIPSRADGRPLDGLDLSVSRFANWHCDFFGLLDCFLGADRIARVHLTPDGRFSADIPDFAADPALAPFRHKGSLRFALEDAGWNTVEELGRMDIDCYCPKPPGWTMTAVH